MKVGRWWIMLALACSLASAAEPVVPMPLAPPMVNMNVVMKPKKMPPSLFRCPASLEATQASVKRAQAEIDKGGTMSKLPDVSLVGLKTLLGKCEGAYQARQSGTPAGTTFEVPPKPWSCPSTKAELMKIYTAVDAVEVFASEPPGLFEYLAGLQQRCEPQFKTTRG